MVFWHQFGTKQQTEQASTANDDGMRSLKRDKVRADPLL